MTTYSELLTSVTHLRQVAASGRLFAILDATDTPAVPVRAQEMGDERAVSLYRGEAEWELSAIAPYLVQADVATLEWIAGSLWPEPWGVLVVAEVTLEVLRTHFRKFLLVESSEGESWYFRFYDPRVLVQYLETCTVPELTEFFGPVQSFGVTDEITYGVKLLQSGNARRETRVAV